MHVTSTLLVSSSCHVAPQVQKLQAVEGHNDKVRENLEQHISVIQKSVAFYENGYNSNMGVLSAIVESLTSILKHVSEFSGGTCLF